MTTDSKRKVVCRAREKGLGVPSGSHGRSPGWSALSKPELKVQGILSEGLYPSVSSKKVPDELGRRERDQMQQDQSAFMLPFSAE